MKVLIVGASGSIGGEVFSQCLARPSISKVVAFVRRELPVTHPKLECVVINDFAAWPEDVLRAHADAAAMIWNMGTNTGSVTADLEYPMAFLESMARVLETTDERHSRRPRFRYVHLSGKFVRQKQEEELWFLEQARKMKGLLETRALAFAESHAGVWETFIVRPGGVVTKNWISPGTIAAVLGENWGVRIEWLGAFMTYLAVDGGGEDHVVECARIVRRGRELFAQQEPAQSESSRSG